MTRTSPGHGFAIRTVLGAALMLAPLCGCGTGEPGAGLTNGPGAGSGEKAAVRDDLPPPAAPKQGEILGEMGDSSTNAGTGGRGADGANKPK